MADANEQVTKLLNGATATGAGTVYSVPRKTTHRAYGAKVVGTGAVTATVLIYGRNGDDGGPGVLLGTITLSGTTSAADGFASDGAWSEVWADCTAISGTGAAVTATMGI